MSERIKEKIVEYGTSSLTTAEIFSVLLGTKKSEAEEILSEIGGIEYIARTDIWDMQLLPYIGKSRVLKLLAAVELSARLQKAKVNHDKQITSSEDVEALVMEEMRYLDREHFKILHLNTKNCITSIETISIGSLNETIVHPREVFKSAIKRGSASLILVHNHPSGDPRPSGADIKITKRLVEIGELVGIPVLDHIIIGDNRHYSLRREGKI